MASHDTHPDPVQAPQTIMTSRPVAITMAVLAVLVFGCVAYTRLPLALLPEISYPSLTIRTDYPGTAPEDVEQEITEPLEQALGITQSLLNMRSTSHAEKSEITLDFTWDTRLDQAVQNVRERIDRVVLPEEASRPIILRYDPSLDPLIRLVLYGDAPLTQLRDIAENHVKRDLELLPGVAAIRVKGGLEEEIRIQLHEDVLTGLNLSVQAIAQRLSEENINLSGGNLVEGGTEFIVRTLNEFRSLDDIRHIVLARRDNTDVRLGDIGTIHRTHKPVEFITRYGMHETVTIEILKNAQANILKTAQTIRDAMFGEPPPGVLKRLWQRVITRGKDVKHAGGRTVQQGLPAGIHMAVVDDQSVFIQSAIQEVKDNALWGGLLAVVVLFLFFQQWAPTIVIAFTIPISIIATFVPLHLSGITLNIMSLGGLAMGIGLLVDNAIVVLEAIAAQREKGESHIQSCESGTRIVRSALVASTLTTIAVFLPVAFLEGVAGQIFGDQGMTVVYALSASLFAAIYFIPMASSRAIFAQHGRLHARTRDSHARTLLLSPFLLPRVLVRAILQIVSWILSPLTKTVRLVLGYCQTAYPKFLVQCLQKPWPILLITMTVFAFAVHLAAGLGFEMIPRMAQDRWEYEISLPVGSPVEQTVACMKQLEKSLSHIPGLQSYEAIGRDKTDLDNLSGEHLARLIVTGDRDALEQHGFPRCLLQAAANIPDLTIHEKPSRLLSLHRPVEVQIHGYELNALKRHALTAAHHIAKVPGLSNTQISLKPGNPEIIIRMDRQRLHRAGLDARRVAEVLRHKIQGKTATRFRAADKKIDMVISLAEMDRKDLEDLKRITINPSAEIPIPLEGIADLEPAEGPSEILRINQERTILVTSDKTARPLSAILQDIHHALDQLPWNEGVSYRLAGQSNEMQRSLQSMKLALALAMTLVYMVMAAQFESLIHPLIIMFTLPLAFIGVILAIHHLAIPLSIMVFLGMILLAGIVVNNAIILVDLAKQLGKNGMPVKESIVQAARDRLRPIMMTSTTTILALLPMAMGIGAGAELRQPMAITVMAGMLSATFLTLLIIPVLYVLVTPDKSKGPRQT